MTMATDTRHKPARAPQPPSGRTPPTDRPSYTPFAIMRQGLDEMDRWFGRLGSDRGWMAPSSGRSWLSPTGQPAGDWMPAIEVFQRGHEVVVRAEVPGMQRQDLTVEAGDDSLTIRGERHQEQDEEREGLFWSERSYGSFTRVIPLPPGTISESAKASFANGVLEVVMQAPSPEARRGRRIDISGQPPEGGGKKSSS
jgi:HSP20 family protein